MSIQKGFVKAGEESGLLLPDLNSESPDKREECVHTDLARRLKGVCGNLESADFEALLVQMTSEQLRGERYRRM